MAASLVELQGAGRRFGQRHALAGVDLAVREGEIVGLAGPNGSGKTTLLKLLAGFLRPSAGSVRVFGLDPFGEALAADGPYAAAGSPLRENDDLVAEPGSVHVFEGLRHEPASP